MSQELLFAAPSGAAVPGRECGTCHVCCIAFRIDDAKLQKRAGAECVNLVKGRGCGIYATRPDTCRNWLCGWRLFAELDDTLRPDRSGVVLIPEFEERPGYGQPGFKVQVTTPDRLFVAPVLNFVCGLVAARTPVTLAVNGLTAKTFINPHLEAAIARRDGNAITAILLSLLEGQMGLGQTPRA